MKHLKKLGSVLLALVMVMALAAPAFAATVTGSTLDVSQGSGHTYKFYQVFKGQLPDDGQVGSLKADGFTWGDNFDSAAAINALKSADLKVKKTVDDEEQEVNPFKDLSDTSDANAVARILSEYYADGKPYSNVGNKTALANAFAKGIRTDVTASVAGNTGALLPFGYWVGVETVGTGTADPAYHLVVADGNPIKITTKKGDSKVDKDVQTVDGAWVNGAVWTEDQEIPFRLVVDLPDDFDKYDANNPFNIVLHDVQSEGLDLSTVEITAVKMFKAGVDITTGKPASELANSNEADGLHYQFITEGTCTNPGGETGSAKIDGCSFEIKVPNLEQNDDAEARGKLVVEYTAKFDPSKVKTGAIGNDNTVHLEVNGVPTNESSVKVFEVELEIEKTDGAGNPLAGAEFTLYKASKGEDGEWVRGEEIAKLTGEQIWQKAPEGATDNVDKEGYLLDGEGDRVPAANSGAHFSYKGLETGSYVLEETTRPMIDGKETNEIDPIYFTITAVSNDVSTIPTLTVTVNDKTVENLKVNDDQDVTTTIVNVTGSLLPETGGIGTTIFYIVGGVLVVGAVVLLITKRRTSVDDE